MNSQAFFCFFLLDVSFLPGCAFFATEKFVLSPTNPNYFLRWHLQNGTTALSANLHFVVVSLKKNSAMLGLTCRKVSLHNDYVLLTFCQKIHESLEIFFCAKNDLISFRNGIYRCCQ